MDQEALLYQVALSLIPKVGAITARKLIEYLGSPEAVFREKPETLRKIPGIGEYLVRQLGSGHVLAQAREEIESIGRSGISCYYYRDEAYPWRLKNCEDGPLLLYFRGKQEFNRTKYLSVVGTRNASRYGCEMTSAIIRELAGKYPELVVVSGLAYGIDIMAHRAALDCGLDTIGVLAHGLNTIYPAAHKETARKMVGQGSLISDFHSSVKPERNNFLRRNRIIAGMSDATLVIESGKKGGALITAELASSYHREIFAVPGRIKDIRSAGCNELIKRNIAALIESAEDIEFSLGWETEEVAHPTKAPLNELVSGEERSILSTLQDDPGIGPDLIGIRTGMPVHVVLSLLVQLEIKKLVINTPGNLYESTVTLD